MTVLDALGTMVYVNPCAERLLGLEPGSALGRSIADFLHPDDLVRALRVMAMMVDEAMDVPITPAIYRVAMIDGGWCPVEMNASVIRSAPGPALVGVAGLWSSSAATPVIATCRIASWSVSSREIRPPTSST